MAEEINKVTHSGMRQTIVLIGHRNAGKSLLFNRLIGQEISIVSDEKGTTTDAVSKAYELDGVGAVSFYDTAGLDDEGVLGSLRVQATQKVLQKADAVIVVVGKDGISERLKAYLKLLKDRRLPLLMVFTFMDERMLSAEEQSYLEQYNGLKVDVQHEDGITEIKKRLSDVLKGQNVKPLVADFIHEGDTAVLVVPQDIGAPKGRLIMPQVQVMRELLDLNATGIMTKGVHFEEVLSGLTQKPKAIICDSTIVKTVAETMKKLHYDDVILTTFSVLFAKAKGNFPILSEGLQQLDNLQDHDKILIAEGCSHHITCQDIGQVKLPKALQKYSGKKLQFTFCQGSSFPDDLDTYKLVLMCGGCVLTQKEVLRRIQVCQEHHIPVTNYGLVFAKVNGVKL